MGGETSSATLDILSKTMTRSPVSTTPSAGGEGVVNVAGGGAVLLATLGI